MNAEVGLSDGFHVEREGRTTIFGEIRAIHGRVPGLEPRLLSGAASVKQTTGWRGGGGAYCIMRDKTVAHGAGAEYFAGTMAEVSAQAARFLGSGGKIPRPVRPAGHTLMELGQVGGAEDLHLRIRTYASGELAFGRSRSEVKAELVAVGWPERLIEQLVPSRREEPLVAFVSGHIALGTSPRKLERCLLAQGVDQAFVRHVVEAARSVTAKANRRLGGSLAAAGSAALMASAGATWVWDSVARPGGAVLLAVGGLTLGLAGTLAGLALMVASWSSPRRTFVL